MSSAANVVSSSSCGWRAWQRVYAWRVIRAKTWTWRVKVTLKETWFGNTWMHVTRDLFHEVCVIRELFGRENFVSLRFLRLTDSKRDAWILLKFVRETGSRSPLCHPHEDGMNLSLGGSNSYQFKSSMPGIGSAVRQVDLSYHLDIFSLVSRCIQFEIDVSSKPLSTFPQLC